jgi:hypothetical protein
VGGRQSAQSAAGRPAAVRCPGQRRSEEAHVAKLADGALQVVIQRVDVIVGCREGVHKAVRAHSIPVARESEEHRCGWQEQRQAAEVASGAQPEAKMLSDTFHCNPLSKELAQEVQGEGP